MADPHGYRPAPGSIPESPGVYRFRDKHGRVIYVGKAKNLRSRLNSYFADFASLHPRTQMMLTTAMVMSAGAESGATMRRSETSGPHPSRMAASKIDDGSCRKNAVKKNTLNGIRNPTYTRIAAG